MYNRKHVFAAACLGMLVFGVVLTMLGAILPSVIEHYGVDKAEAGSLFLLLSFGILLGSIGFGPIVDRYGYKYLLVVCTIIVLVGLEGIAFAPSFDFLRATVLMIGIGGGVINGGTNALVADISTEGKSANLSILGIFLGLGAFGVPFSLGFLLNVFTYTSLIAVIGALVAGPIVFFLVVRFPDPKQAQGFPLREGLSLVKEKPLLLLGLMLFLQSGIEITVGGWTATFLHEVLAVDASRSVFFLSLFWAGIVIARLILGVLLRTRRPDVVLKAFMGIAFLGALMLLASTNLYLAAPGIFLIGFGLAAGFPIVLGYTGELYAKLSGTAFSIVLVMALSGGSLVPWLAGIIGEAYGLRPSFLMVPLGLVLILGVLTIFLRRTAYAASRDAAVGEV